MNQEDEKEPAVLHDGRIKHRTLKRQQRIAHF